MKILIIEWIDAFGCPPGWEYEDDAEMIATSVTSVGFLLKKTKDFYLLAPHKSDPGEGRRRQIAGHIAIPRRQVVKVTRITS